MISKIWISASKSFEEANHELDALNIFIGTSHVSRAPMMYLRSGRLKRISAS